MAAKLPYFPFYPDDWLSDEKLRMCSSAAIGLWIDMLCLMHKNDRRGYLQAGDKPVSATQLARMTGRTTDEVSHQLAELLHAGVPSVTEHGVLYSRKMVRHEQIRAVRSEAGRMGGNPVLLKQTPKQNTSKPLANHKQNAECGIGIGSETLFAEGGGAGGTPANFDAFWEVYPRHQGKKAARKAWERLHPDDDLLKQIIEAIGRQKGWRDWRGGYIPHPATWLNGRRWEDEAPPESLNGRAPGEYQRRLDSTFEDH